jgi:HD domain-containing protein
MGIRRQPVFELDRAEAAALFTGAIGRAMKLDRATLLVLEDASTWLLDRPLRHGNGSLSHPGTGHHLEVAEAILFRPEHWDGGGFPGAIGGEMIPLTSRILAVADAWAGLTAKDSPGLSHYQALNQLEARAGLHFDPRVVRAAIEVAEQAGLCVASPQRPHSRDLPVVG